MSETIDNSVENETDETPAVVLTSSKSLAGFFYLYGPGGSIYAQADTEEELEAFCNTHGYIWGNKP